MVRPSLPSTIPSGLVQSSTILPLRFPIVRIAPWVSGQGVVNTMTSAKGAASCGRPACTLPRMPPSTARVYSDAGWRTPKNTWWPAFSAQVLPSAPPTLPAPMIAIFMTAFPAVLHQHLAFFGDGIFQLLGGVAEQHLVVGAARRDHREAVFRRVDHAVAQHRPVDIDHLLDRMVEIARLLAANADGVHRLGELDEVRQRLRLAFRIAAAVQQFLPQPHHAHVLVVQYEDL